MDGLSSLIDVVSSLFLVFCIVMAAKPPDEDHPFGHGRFEPLVGLQLGGILSFVGLITLIYQLFTFSFSPLSEVDTSAWIIPVLAVILLEICYQRVVRAAKKENSPALLADALHYRMDGLTSLIAAIALIIAAFLPQWSSSIDILGAIVISATMIGAGGFALKKNLDQLVDKVPDASYFEKVKNAALRVEGVKSTHKIRIQNFGPNAHVDIDIQVDPFLTVDIAHAISQKVRLEIQRDWPLVQDVIVHIEPYYPTREFK